MGDRPSEDVDLFTNQADADEFACAVGRLRSAYLAAGLEVEDERVLTTFAEFLVTEPATGEGSSVQLGPFRLRSSMSARCSILVTRSGPRCPPCGHAGRSVTTSTSTPSSSLAVRQRRRARHRRPVPSHAHGSKHPCGSVPRGGQIRRPGFRSLRRELRAAQSNRGGLPGLGRQERLACRRLSSGLTLWQYTRGVPTSRPAVRNPGRPGSSGRYGWP